MRLQNLYNSEVWVALSSLYKAAAVLNRDGNILLSGGELADSLQSFILQKQSPIRNRLDKALKGEHLEFLIDIDHSELPEFIKVQPLLDESGMVEAVLVTAEEAPRDVLRLSEVQARLNEYEFIVNSIRQGIWQLDSKGIVTACNPYLATWLEYSESEIIGKRASSFMVGQVADRQHSPNFEAEFVTKTGITRHALVASCPALAADGSVAGTIDIITDITAEHALNTKLVSEVQKMAKLASIDPLTGAANRLTFDVALDNMVSAADTTPFGVAVLDLDFFKQVNDSYGHAAGDRVLVEVVTRLKRFVRNSDIVARLGGDEFVVLLADASEELTAQIAKRLAERLQFFLSFEGSKVPVRVSVGWAHSSEGVQNILHRADSMLYVHKRDERKGQTIADIAQWIDSHPEIL